MIMITKKQKKQLIKSIITVVSSLLILLTIILPLALHKKTTTAKPVIDSYEFYEGGVWISIRNNHHKDWVYVESITTYVFQDALGNPIPEIQVNYVTWTNPIVLEPKDKNDLYPKPTYYQGIPISSLYDGCLLKITFHYTTSVSDDLLSYFETIWFHVYFPLFFF